MVDRSARLRDDLTEAGIHPRDAAFRTGIPFERVMAMWRGEVSVDFSESSRFARLTGRRSDYYRSDDDADPG